MGIITFEYEVHFKVKGFTGDYNTIYGEIKTAAEKFNEKAQKDFKSRRIRDVKVNGTEGFTVHLSSDDKLESPARGMQIFSKELGRFDKLKNYVKDGRLLQSSSFEEIQAPSGFQGTPHEVFKIFNDLFLAPRPSDNYEARLQELARGKILEVCKEVHDFYNS